MKYKNIIFCSNFSHRCWRMQPAEFQYWHCGRSNPDQSYSHVLHFSSSKRQYSFRIKRKKIQYQKFVFPICVNTSIKINKMNSWKFETFHSVHFFYVAYLFWLALSSLLSRANIHLLFKIIIKFIQTCTLKITFKFIRGICRSKCWY